MPLCSIRSPRILPTVKVRTASRSRSGAMPNTCATAIAASRFITACRPVSRAFQNPRPATRNAGAVCAQLTSSARTSALFGETEGDGCARVHFAESARRARRRH